ncbi:MAG TPA: UvrD-helicase domain-containing protein [Gemmataceae bacterium]|nr:UvrD-helicase domain-containing protein [Gemmataceae bacterium]
MLQTSNYLQFKDSQRHALDTARNLAVRANAGSGKTSVLVERVVQLLERRRREEAPLNITSIVAITFTRKAAAEFQDRLRASFQECVQAADEREEAGFWTEQIDLLPRAMIGTIDGFCARILREFAWLDESLDRLEPDFQPMEGFEEYLLKQEAVDRVINRLSAPREGTPTPEEEAEIEACRWWATTQGYGSLNRHLIALLNHMMDAETILETHRNLSAAPNRVEQWWSAQPVVAFVHTDRGQVRANLQHLHQIIRALKKSNGSLDKLQNQLSKVIFLLENDDRHSLQEALALLKKALFNDEGKERKQGFGAIAAQVIPLQETWKPYLEDFAFDFDGEVAALEAADRLVRIFKPVQADYQQLCHQVSRYDFLTLARRTRDLLARSPRVRKDLKERWRYIMVDEFQDTNRLQWEIISWLVGEGPAGLLDADRLFIVGDPQQSIYRFRNADVSVFSHVQQVIENANRHHGNADKPTDYDQVLEKPSSDSEQRQGVMRLKENFRTLYPVPLGLLDQVFRFVFDPDAHQLDLANHKFEIRYQPFTPGQASESQACGEVIYVIPSNPESEKDDPDEELQPDLNDGEAAKEVLGHRQVVAVVDQLLQMHGRPRLGPDEDGRTILEWKDMAVLLPSRTVVLTELEKELHRRRIPFVVTKGIGFWQRQEVRDLVNLAATLADPGDELALFAVLRSPLGQLTDTEILFLSQLGLGSLDRGLKKVAKVENTLQAGLTSAVPAGPPEVNPADGVLEEVWRGFSSQARDRLGQTSRRIHIWRQRVDRIGHADLLQRALEESHALALYAAEFDGEIILGNLTRLFELIRAEEEQSGPGLARLTRLLRQQVDNSLKEAQASLALGPNAIQIMTVHAAKGLEFPLVAVMKMERKADSGSYPPLMVVSESDVLLAEDAKTLGRPNPGTVSVRIRHPKRPRELYTPTLLRALHKLDLARDLAESRRLFYVAATRAKERLILAGKQPKKNNNGALAKVPVSWQRWFEEALGITEVHKQAGLWEDPKKGFRLSIITDVSGDKEWSGSEGSKSPELIALGKIKEGPLVFTSTVSELDEMVGLWENDKPQWFLRYRAHLLPNVKLPPREKSARHSRPKYFKKIGTIIGILVHRLLEVWDSNLFSQISNLLPTMAGNLLSQRSTIDQSPEEENLSMAPSAEVEEIVAAVQSILQKISNEKAGSKEIRTLAEGPGQTEVDFGLQLGRYQITGRFDKLLVTCAGYEIVDWKSDRDEDPAAITQRYQNQMKLYALALLQTGKAGLVQNAVCVRLVLLHHLQVVLLSFPVAELAAFADSLTAELTKMESYVLEHDTPGSSQ